MKKCFYLLACLTVVFSCKDDEKQTYTMELKKIEVKYPSTKKDSTIKDNYFGTEVADPYRWLENDTSTETTAWVSAENELTQGYLSQIPFRQEIKKRYA